MYLRERTWTQGLYGVLSNGCTKLNLWPASAMLLEAEITLAGLFNARSHCGNTTADVASFLENSHSLCTNSRSHHLLHDIWKTSEPELQEQRIVYTDSWLRLEVTGSLT